MNAPCGMSSVWPQFNVRGQLAAGVGTVPPPAAAAQPGITPKTVFKHRARPALYTPHHPHSQIDTQPTTLATNAILLSLNFMSNDKLPQLKGSCLKKRQWVLMLRC